MNQPPITPRPPAWRRPRGVAPGTWDYVHERTIADHYDAFVADTPLCRLDAEAVRDFVQSISSHDSLVIADFGCGSGRLSLPLLRQGHHVIGVDLSHRMLEVAVTKAADEGLQSRFLPLHANLVELNCLGDKSLDAAICMFSTYGMIQGKSNRVEFLKHVRRSLRPEGRLLLHVHSQWSTLWEPRGTTRLVSSLIRSSFSKNMEWGDSVYAYRGLSDMYLHRFSRQALRSELHQAGWKITQLQPIALDGSQVLTTRTASLFRAGGFFVTACQAETT